MSKSHENRVRRVRRAANREGLLLCKARTRNPNAEEYGRYVLVDDCKGNRLPGAQAPKSEFAGGWGRTLDDIEDELNGLANS